MTDQRLAAGEGRKSVDQALDVIGERWALLVVRELLRGAQRFSDLLNPDGLDAAIADGSVHAEGKMSTLRRLIQVAARESTSCSRYCDRVLPSQARKTGPRDGAHRAGAPRPARRRGWRLPA